MKVRLFIGRGIPTDKTNYTEFLTFISSLNEGELCNARYTTYIHINDLLVFNSKASFYRHEAYIYRSILMEDKVLFIYLEITKGIF